MASPEGHRSCSNEGRLPTVASREANSGNWEQGIIVRKCALVITKDPSHSGTPRTCSRSRSVKHLQTRVAWRHGIESLSRHWRRLGKLPFPIFIYLNHGSTRLICIALLLPYAMKDRTCFRDNAENDIDLILVIEQSEDDTYRVTEKRDGSWCAPFLMPAGELRATVHVDGVDSMGRVSDKQLEAVLDQASA